MKRRLTSAYDHMTMPESCSQSIEKKLEESMKQQRAGRYTKIVPPERPRQNGWFTAVAAVCLVMVLSVGGSALLLRGLPQMEHRPVETVVTVLPYAGETPPDHYKEVTNRPVEEVENFAKIVAHNILQKNWAALENKVQFPVTIQEEEVTDWKTFVEKMDAYFGHYLYKDRIGRETCQAMFCNWQGISMANGLIWINEEGGSLKITAVDVEIQEEPVEAMHRKQVPEVLAEMLSGDRIKLAGVMNQLTIDEYCTYVQEDAKLDAFAVVDMDGDNVCELVYSMMNEQGAQCGYLVLRQAGNEIYGYPFRSGELLDLKKDGTFCRRDREYRLLFNNREGWNMWYTEELQNQPEKPLAQWYAYPCQRPDLLLKACEFETGTGWNSFPGIPYSYFESVVQGRASNNLQTFLYRGMDHTVMENDKIYIFDPDAPGTVVYGTVTEENGSQRFSELGFYMATGEKEYMAEVRNMLSEEPEYWVDAHLPALGSMGRQVFRPEEVISYLGFSSVPDEQTLKDQQEIRSLVDDFVAACLTGDPKAMEPYLAENAQGRVGKFPKDKALELIDYGVLPDQTMGEWGRYVIHPKAKIQGQEGQFQLYLELVKQPDGWKVETYRVER